MNNGNTLPSLPLSDWTNAPRRSGVYRIRNRVTGECYVGKAKNLRDRAHSHASELRTGSHHAKALQASYDQHGEVAFWFEVLEFYAFSIVPWDREFFWISKLQPTFNTTGMTNRPASVVPVEPRRNNLRAKVLHALASEGVSKYELVQRLKGTRPDGRDVPPATVYGFLRGESDINCDDFARIMWALDLELVAS